MKTRIQIQSLPEAEPIPDAVVSVRSLATGVTITSDTTDADGFYTLQRSGHLDPYYLYMSGLPGGDKFWRSDEMMTAGPTSPWDWPMALMPIGNGVIVGYEGELAISVSGTTISIRNGAALIAGHPFVQRDDGAIMSPTRPVSGTRTDRIVVRLYSGAGLAGHCELARLEGTDTIGTPAGLTQTTDIYDLPLARVNIPAAGTLSVDDERNMLHPQRHAPVTDQVVANGPFVTDEAGGEALTGMEIVLDLLDEGTYDITASLSAVQGPVAGSTNWTNVGTYGPTFGAQDLSDPGQVAIDATGHIWIASTGNNRAVRLYSDGSYKESIFGLTGITGVCADSSGNIYVVFTSGSFTPIRKYNSSLVVQWTTGLSVFQSAASGRHLATDGTYVYLTYTHPTAGHRVGKWQASDGAVVASWGSSGSGDGQFTTPWGITTNGTKVWVVDTENSRVQRFTTAGVYEAQYPISYGARGIARDLTGNHLIAEPYVNVVDRFTADGTYIDYFPQTNSSGIAVATGDVVWVSNASTGAIHTWDEITTGAGYGQLAVEIDGSVGTYVGPGNRDVSVMTVETGSKAGGYGVTSTIRAFGKATSGEATFKSLVLSAEARPRR